MEVINRKFEKVSDSSFKLFQTEEREYNIDWESAIKNQFKLLSEIKTNKKKRIALLEGIRKGITSFNKKLKDGSATMPSMDPKAILDMEHSYADDITGMYYEKIQVMNSRNSFFSLEKRITADVEAFNRSLEILLDAKDELEFDVEGLPEELDLEEMLSIVPDEEEVNTDEE